MSLFGSEENSVEWLLFLLSFMWVSKDDVRLLSSWPTESLLEGGWLSKSFIAISLSLDRHVAFGEGGAE